MNFDLIVGKNDYNESINFLNSSAYDFFCGNNTYSDGNFPIILKANIQAGFVDFERMLRGTFDSDLHMDNASMQMLKEMFPNAFNNMFKIKKQDDIKRFGFFLESLRNINSHAVLSEKDKKIFSNDFSFLKYQKVFNWKIKYYTDTLTVGGFIFILFNFLRPQSIESLAKVDNLFGLISCGYYGRDNGEKFVNEISHVNFELDIRQERGDDLAGAVFGEYQKLMDIEDGEFHLQIGMDLHPTYYLNGYIDNDGILIRKSSLTKTYYDNDYYLKIVDVAGFVEFSNLLPPCVLVDYLHDSGITIFDTDTYRQVQAKWQLISKLNKPKFYSDKNIKILLMPETIADFRFVSSIISDNLQKIFLLIENYIYSNKHIDTNGNFSTIMDAFKEVDANKTLSLNITLLRNMVSHGYILDEYFMFKNKQKVFSIDFIIEILSKMLELLKNDEPDAYQVLGQAISSYLINKLVSSKYKQASRVCLSLMDTYPDYDGNDLMKKDSYIQHSMLDITRFNCLITEDYLPIKVICMSLDGEGLPTKLYLLDTPMAIEKLDEFCEKHNFIIAEKHDNGLLIDYKIKKSNL